MGLEIDERFVAMKGHYFLFNAGEDECSFIKIVQRSLIIIFTIYYLIFFTATAPVVPFIPVYAKQLGYSAVVVGLIYTILPIGKLLIIIITIN